MTVSFSQTTYQLSAFISEITLHLFLESFQRLSNQWKLVHQRLLISTILNNYFMPELTLHPLELQRNHQSYSVIDGQQRIHTIMRYVNNEFFVIINDMNVYYNDIHIRNPLTHRVLTEPEKIRFDMYTIRVATINCDTELEKIEQFTRLNQHTAFKQHDNAWMIRGTNSLFGAFQSVIQGLDPTVMTAFGITSTYDDMFEEEKCVPFDERMNRSVDPRSDLIKLIPMLIASLENNVSSLCTKGMTDSKKSVIMNKEYGTDDIQRAIVTLTRVASIYQHMSYAPAHFQKTLRSFTHLTCLIFYDILHNWATDVNDLWWAKAVERCEREDGIQFFKDIMVGYDLNVPMKVSIARERTDRIKNKLGENPFTAVI